jgi:hypothetical protein
VVESSCQYFLVCMHFAVVVVKVTTGSVLAQHLNEYSGTTKQRALAVAKIEDAESVHVRRFSSFHFW